MQNINKSVIIALNAVDKGTDAIYFAAVNGDTYAVGADIFATKADTLLGMTNIVKYA